MDSFLQAHIIHSKESVNFNNFQISSLKNRYVEVKIANLKSRYTAEITITSGKKLKLYTVSKTTRTFVLKWWEMVFFIKTNVSNESCIGR